jgi:hypothetical protein
MDGAGEKMTRRPSPRAWFQAGVSPAQVVVALLILATVAGVVLVAAAKVL